MENDVISNWLEAQGHPKHTECCERLKKHSVCVQNHQVAISLTVTQ